MATGSLHSKCWPYTFPEDVCYIWLMEMKMATSSVPNPEKKSKRTRLPENVAAGSAAGIQRFPELGMTALPLCSLSLNLPDSNTAWHSRWCIIQSSTNYCGSWYKEMFCPQHRCSIFAHFVNSKFPVCWERHKVNFSLSLSLIRLF